MDQESSLYLRYISLSRKKKLTQEQVRLYLIEEGWNKSQIERLFKDSSNQNPINKNSIAQKNDKLLNLRLVNGKLYLKALVLALVIVGSATIWLIHTPKPKTYQSVLSNFLSALEKHDQIKAQSLESQTEKQQLNTSNHSFYNYCNSSAQICAKALSADKLKTAELQTVPYSTNIGIKGEEQIISEKLAGCAGMVKVYIVAYPTGNSWVINSVNIIGSAAVNKCNIPKTSINTPSTQQQGSATTPLIMPHANSTPVATTVRHLKPVANSSKNINAPVHNLLPPVNLNISQKVL